MSHRDGTLFVVYCSDLKDLDYADWLEFEISFILENLDSITPVVVLPINYGESLLACIISRLKLLQSLYSKSINIVYYLQDFS